MSAAKKSFLNMICGIFGQLVIVVLGIVIPRLVLVSFGSEVNGLLNSSSQIFTYFNLFEAGIGIACLQGLYAPVANEDRKAISSIMVAAKDFYMRTGILYAGAVIVLAFIYPFLVNTDLSYGLIVAVILFGGLGNSLNFLFQGKYTILMQAEGLSFVSTNITTVVNVLINLSKAILLTLGFGVIEVQVAGFVISLLQMGIYYLYVRKKYDWIDYSQKPNISVLSQKKATFVHQISSMVFSNTDMVLLTLITKNLKTVSVYSLYFLVTNSVLLMLQTIPAGIDFRLGQLYNTDKDKYFPLYHLAEICYIVLAFSALSVIYILLIPFIRLYTAGITDISYIDRWYPLFFVIVPIITIGRFTPMNLINHAGHFKATQYRAVAETTINLIVSLFGIYYFGIIGALTGTIVATLYRTTDVIIYVYKHLINDNPFITFKRWIGAITVFIIVYLRVDIMAIKMESYVQIIGYGILIGIVVLIINLVVQMLINPNQVKFVLKLIKTKHTNR